MGSLIIAGTFHYYRLGFFQRRKEMFFVTVSARIISHHILNLTAKNIFCFLWLDLIHCRKKLTGRIVLDDDIRK